MITADEFVARFGEVIDVDDLARLLSASRRETQALLRSKGVELATIGSRQIVAADRAAAALGLTEEDAAIAEMARVRREMSHRADGTRKSPREYLAERSAQAAVAR
jgi:hypothetical protein